MKTPQFYFLSPSHAIIVWKEKGDGELLERDKKREARGEGETANWKVETKEIDHIYADRNMITFHSFKSLSPPPPITQKQQTHYSLTVFYTYLLYLPTHPIYKKHNIEDIIIIININEYNKDDIANQYWVGFLWHDNVSL